MNRKMYIFIVFLFLMFISSGIVKGADPIEYKLLEPLPCAGNSGEVTAGGCADGTLVSSYKQNEFGAYMVQIYRLGIGLGIALAVIMISWGGFKLATTDSFSKSSEGKKTVENAIYGLLMVLCSYIILYYIDPRYVNFNANFDPLSLPAAYTQVYDYNEDYAAATRSLGTNIQTSNTSYKTLKTEYTDLTAKREAARIAKDYTEVSRLDAEIKTKGEAVFNTALQLTKDTIAQDVYSTLYISGRNPYETQDELYARLGTATSGQLKDLVVSKFQNVTGTNVLSPSQIQAMNRARTELNTLIAAEVVKAQKIYNTNNPGPEINTSDVPMAN